MPAHSDPAAPAAPAAHAATLASPHGFALFLDFDGTLVEIAERPEAVVVAPDLGETLERLRDRLGGALAIVSGRPVATIDHFLAPHWFDVAGLHGAEHRLDGVLSPCRAEDHPAIRGAVARLKDHFAFDPRILIEDKGASVAVHWRRAPERAHMALPLVEAVAGDLGGAYRLQKGKAVAEILPAGAAKGSVIARFLDSAPYRGRRPMFIGDDLTDEHAFELVNKAGGVSVRVGPGPTGATHTDASPAALRARLANWATTGNIAFDGTV